MVPEGKQHIISITSGTMVKAILWVLLFIALFKLQNVLLILLTSVIIASAIEPFIRWQIKYKIPRIVAVIIVYLVVFAVLFGILLLFIPPLINEIGKLSETVPGYLSTFNFSNLLPEALRSDNLIGNNLVDSLSLSDSIGQIKNALAGLTSGFFQTVARVFGGALSATMILVISFYFAVQEGGIENFIRVVTPFKKEKYVISLWKRTQDKIGKWLQGQLLLGVIIGILVYLGLTLFSVPYATSLAALAAVLELIPIFGPIIAAVPAVIVGFSQSPGLGLGVLALYLIIQQFENQLIYPLVVTKIVGISPILVILALLAGGTLYGFMGIVLAIPVSVVFVELFNDLAKEKMAMAAGREKNG